MKCGSRGCLGVLVCATPARSEPHRPQDGGRNPDLNIGRSKSIGRRPGDDEGLAGPHCVWSLQFNEGAALVALLRAAGNVPVYWSLVGREDGDPGASGSNKDGVETLDRDVCLCPVPASVAQGCDLDN